MVDERAAPCWIAVGSAVDAVRRLTPPFVPRSAAAAGRLLGSRPMTEVASVLFGREDIRRRVEELGRAITGDYAGRSPCSSRS